MVATTGRNEEAAGYPGVDAPSVLRITAFAIAATALAIAAPPTFATACALLAALALFALAEYQPATVPPLSTSSVPARYGRPAIAAILLGIVLCSVAAVAVARHASLLWQHLPWAGGLLSFAIAAACSASPPVIRCELRDRLALAGLAVVCLVAFGWQLSAIPTEVHGDEAEVALDALRLLEEPGRSLFSTSWFGLPILHAAPTAVGLLLFGNDLFGLRVTSALVATATVLLLYSVVRRLGGRRLALIAALLLVGQRYFVHLARAGYHYVDTPFLSLLVLWLGLRLWQEHRASAAVWCGVWLGIAVQTYYASRLIPVLLAATTLIGVATRRGPRLAMARDLAVIAAIAMAIASPLAAFYVDAPDDLWSRTYDTSIFNPEARQHLAFGHGTDELAPLMRIQTWSALSMFHGGEGDTSVQFGLKRPLLDALSGVFFLAGVGCALARFASPLHHICIVWIALPLLMGGALTIDTPFYPRLSGIVPFACVLTAIGLLGASQTVATVFAVQRRNQLTAALAVAITVTVLAVNWQAYFKDYAPYHRHSPMREISEWINGEGRGVKTYLIDQRKMVSIYHGTVSFLAGQHARHDVEDIHSFFSGPPLDRLRSRFILMPGSENVLPLIEERYGRFVTAEHRNIHNDLLFVSARPADAGKPPEPRSPLPPLARAVPWLAFAALLIAIASAGAWRQRSRPAPMPPPVFAPSAERPPPPSTAGGARVPAWLAAAAVVGIVVLAGWLRIYQLAELPAGFYCDEAGNLYNSASILRTGRDETGAFLPLYIWSFDTSYKNPVFVYATTAAVAMFGPTPFAARLTAAVFGIVGVVGTFILGRALFGTFAGLVAGLLLAVVPWHVHFSRIAFELISFPTIFVAAAVCMVGFARGHRSLVAAAALIGLSLYTYVPAKLFVPLFCGGFVLLYRRELWQRRRETILAGLVLAITVTPVAIFDLTNDNRASRYFRDTTFLSSELSISEIAGQLVNNYSQFFSPTFFFREGDRILRHAVLDHGELYPVLGPLLIFGVVACVTSRRRSTALLLFWLVLYPLAASFIRREIPSASRGIIGVPALCLLAAAGADWWWQQARRLGGPQLRSVVVRSTAFVAFAIVLATQTTRYWTMFSEDYAEYAAKYFVGFQYGHQQVVDYFHAHYDDYDQLILTTTWSNQPEVFLRLFSGMQQPPGDDPPLFRPPAKIKRGTPEELHLYESPRTLFAVVPRDLLYFDDYEVVDRVVAPDGTAAFLMTEVREVKDFVHVWMIAGPYPAHQTPPLPEYDPADPPQQAPGERPWQRYQLRKAPVYVDHLYGHETDDSCAWAINYVYSTEDREVRVFAGFDDRGEIWINGARIPVVNDDNPFYTWIDTTHGSAELRGGRNQIAIKTCDLGGSWSFYFRIADEQGHNLANLDWEYVFEEGF